MGIWRNRREIIYFLQIVGEMCGFSTRRVYFFREAPRNLRASDQMSIMGYEHCPSPLSWVLRRHVPCAPDGPSCRRTGPGHHRRHRRLSMVRELGRS